MEEARQVSYFGSGVKGNVIGKGGSLVAMTDDLYSGFKDGLNPAYNNEIHMWYKGSHLSRIEGASIIDVGTRWSEDDIISYNDMMGRYDKVVKIPALDENDESTCPDVKTTEQYRQLRQQYIEDNEEYQWNAEYQQSPETIKGAIFNKKSLKWFRIKDLTERPDSIIATIDVADKGDDFLCMPIGYVYGYDVYIVDVVFTREPVEVTEELCAIAIEKYNIDVCMVETNNAGRQFLRSVKNLTNNEKCQFEENYNTTNKETRIKLASGYIKSHFFFRNDTNVSTQYQGYLSNLTTYRLIDGVKNKHDDAPDATAGMKMLVDQPKASFESF